jgi:hypothetical protein
VVSTKKDIQRKVQNGGTIGMFAGYSIDHANDVYQMLNLETNYIINSRGINWIKMNHKIWMMQDNSVSHYVSYDEDGSMIFK